jgi:hypothetical protein
MNEASALQVALASNLWPALVSAALSERLVWRALAKDALNEKRWQKNMQMGENAAARPFRK